MSSTSTSTSSSRVVGLRSSLVNATQHVVDAVTGKKDIAALPITQSKKILLALTSAKEKMPDGHFAGWFWTECNHPFDEFRKAGYDCDCVSETGSQYLEEMSLGLSYSSISDQLKHDNPKYPLNQKLKEIRAANQVTNVADYCAIYFVGGHGCCWDFPTATNLQNLAAQIYEAGGVVGAVCHGSIIFENLKLSNGEFLITGKSVTGFSEKGEKSLEWMHEQGLKSVPESVRLAGGIWKEHETNMMACFTLVDGRVVTGMNPASAAEVATKMLSILPNPETNLSLGSQANVVLDSCMKDGAQGDPLFNKTNLGLDDGTAQSTELDKERMEGEGGIIHHPSAEV